MFAVTGICDVQYTAFSPLNLTSCYCRRGKSQILTQPLWKFASGRTS